MKTVYKYQLQLTDYHTVQVHSGYELLAVQVQHGFPCLWAKVDRDQKTESLHLRIAGTGHDLLPGEDQYIDTFQLNEGNLIFHVFRVDSELLD